MGQGLQHWNDPQTRFPQPLSWKLIEARSVLGGRLKNDGQFQEIDMGGAWIWPQHQPYVKQLVRSLHIPTFPQPDDPSSTRIEGGAVRLVEEIVKDIHSSSSSSQSQSPNSNPKFLLDTPVSKCVLETDQETGERIVRVETSGPTLYARQVVLAAPPRLLHAHIRFEPPLSPSKQQAMQASHTWMAGVTKVALVYDTKFWNRHHSNMGLPSFRGPAFQVYDGSTKDNTLNALTFFTLAKTKETQESDEILAQQVADQMAFLWNHLGEKELAQKVTNYSSHHVQRWPLEQFISEEKNPQTINPHPSPVPALSEPEWDGLLHFAGSETDRMSPGVMEGAVGAAKRVLQSLEDFFLSRSASQCRAADAASEK